MSHLIQIVLPLLCLFLSPLRFSSSSSSPFSFLRHFSSFLKFIVYLEFLFFTFFWRFFLACSFAFVFPAFFGNKVVFLFFRACGNGSLFLSLTSCFAHGNVEKRETKEHSTIPRTNITHDLPKSKRSIPSTFLFFDENMSSTNFTQRRHNLAPPV